jgi:hypothetical protein
MNANTPDRSTAAAFPRISSAKWWPIVFRSSGRGFMPGAGDFHAWLIVF